MKKILLILSMFSLTSLYAGEKNLYDFNWLDPDKAVYVLQNKVYEKEYTWYANVGYGFSTSQDFQDASSIQVKTGFYFTEEWGIELLYTKVSNSNSDTYKNVEEATSNVPYVRRFNTYYGAMAIFSPFYGKINTFNQIFYFDWNFGLGVVSVDNESNYKFFKQGVGTETTYDSESHTGFIYKMALRFFVTKNIDVNFDLIQTRISVDSITSDKKVGFTNTDFIFAIGFSI